MAEKPTDAKGSIPADEKITASAKVLEGEVVDSSESKTASKNEAQESSSLAFKKHEKPAEKVDVDIDKNVDKKAKPSASQSKDSSKASMFGFGRHTAQAKTTNTENSAKLAKSSKTLWLVSLGGFLLAGSSVLIGLQNSGAVNELRNDLNQVQTKQAHIMDAQDAMGALPKSFVTAEQFDTQMALVQADVKAALKTQFAEFAKTERSPMNEVQLATIDAKQVAFEKAIRDELSQVLANLNTPVVAQDGKVDLTPVTQKLALLEQKLQSMTPTIVAQNAADSASAGKIKSVIPFATLQQWIMETNTQWLLGASAEATMRKLNSIEEAAVASGFEQVTVLARLIGEDLAYLKSWQESAAKPLPSLDALLQAVNDIQPPQLTAEQMPKAQVSNQAVLDTEMVQEETAWVRLMDRLSEVVTIKNRSLTGEPTTVEALLKHDIQKQRLMLLVERMQWSAEKESQQRYLAAIDAVKIFVSVNFANNLSQFEQLLVPFTEYKRNERQALATAKFHVKP